MQSWVSAGAAGLTSATTTKSNSKRYSFFSMCSCLDGAYVQHLTVFLLQVLRQQGLDYATWKRDIEQQRLRMEGYSQVIF